MIEELTNDLHFQLSQDYISLSTTSFIKLNSQPVGSMKPYQPNNNSRQRVSKSAMFLLQNHQGPGTHHNDQSHGTDLDECRP